MKNFGQRSQIEAPKYEMNNRCAADDGIPHNYYGETEVSHGKP
jgi:hypothetical protein